MVNILQMKRYKDVSNLFMVRAHIWQKENLKLGSLFWSPCILKLIHSVIFSCWWIFNFLLKCIWKSAFNCISCWPFTNRTGNEHNHHQKPHLFLLSVTTTSEILKSFKVNWIPDYPSLNTFFALKYCNFLYRTKWHYYLMKLIIFLNSISEFSIFKHTFLSPKYSLYFLCSNQYLI